jgi:hypothetical protein
MVKKFLNSLSDVRFAAEYESEVKFLLQAQVVKLESDVKLKNVRNCRPHEHP